MIGKFVSLHILPDEKSVSVPRGINARDALIKVGITLNDYCGGNGQCGKCRLRFLENAPAPSLADEVFFSKDELAKGYRLACMAHLEKPATIFIPESSRSKAAPVLIGRKGAEISPQSELKKVYVKLAPASLENQLSDLDLLRNALKDTTLCADVPFLEKLPGILRASDYAVTVTLFGKALVDIEAGNHSSEAGEGAFGAAFDLGTTTIAGALYNLDTGRLLARLGRLNPQTCYGADVVSRIQFASQSPAQLNELREKVVNCINDILAELCSAAGIPKESVGYVALAGNSTMEHLFLGIPPDNLPVAPYVPVYRDGLLLLAEEAGIMAHPRARLYVFPTIGGFVGGDTVADLLAAGIFASEELALLIDIGTNGEIVLGNKGRILATSTAAGPAFEGRNIHCGMRAENGAIDHIAIDGRVKIHTIGDAPPAGLCGSGLIDLAAEMLRNGLLDASGRFIRSDETTELNGRFEKTDAGLKFLLAAQSEGAARDIYFLQKDVRELQLAKGAIAVGTTLLLKEYGASVDEVDVLYLAGAFGNFIRPESAMRIGLIPQVSEGKIRFIGDAALTGAGYALLRKDMRERAEAIAQDVEFVELAGRKDFQDVFAEAMLFV